MPEIDKNAALSLTPLGAGDLIDRAVRLYRKNFLTFIFIASPPVVVGTVLAICWRMLAQALFRVDRLSYNGETEFYYLFLWLGSAVIWFVELAAAFTVMGGASRNFVRHLLFGEKMSFAETYRNVKGRAVRLLTASVFIMALLAFIFFVVLMVFYIVALLSVLLTVAAFSFSPFLATVISVALVAGLIFLCGWLFFLVAGNFIYVPQAMLVEGQPVMAAIARSSSLARGNARRLYALFAFTLVAIYAALALLYIPLGWYAWIEGIQVFSWDPDAIPAWYEIAGQFVGQASLILLFPVWMIGLCILYVDERVRHEGYDIELMAAQRLGEIPAVPREYVNPLNPAISSSAKSVVPPPQRPSQPAPAAPSDKTEAAPASKDNGGLTTLGLN